MISAMVLRVRRRSGSADEGRYPNVSMAASTRCRVSSQLEQYDARHVMLLPVRHQQDELRLVIVALRLFPLIYLITENS